MHYARIDDCSRRVNIKKIDLKIKRSIIFMRFS
jgi:hypothetical protein